MFKNTLDTSNYDSLLWLNINWIRLKVHRSKQGHCIFRLSSSGFNPFSLAWLWQVYPWVYLHVRCSYKSKNKHCFHSYSSREMTDGIFISVWTLNKRKSKFLPNLWYHNLIYTKDFTLINHIYYHFSQNIISVIKQQIFFNCKII